MAFDQKLWSFVAGVGGTVVVFLFTLPSVFWILSHARESKPKSHIYEDKDGLSSEKATAAFSNTVPKLLLAFFAATGISTSIALAVLSTVGEDHGMFIHNWLNVAQWGLLCFQVTALLFIRDCVRSFDVGICASLSSLFLLAVILFQDGFIATSYSTLGSSAEIGCRTSQIGFAVVIAFSGASLPRRPEVFKNGKIVDRMYTASALSRYSFAWMEHLVQLARKNNRLEIEDLPTMDHNTRSKDLSESWASKERPGKLWFEIIFEHKWSFILQLVLTLIQAFGNFAPQFVTFHLLQILESRQMGQPVSTEAWMWVATLTIVTLTSNWIEAWLYWISWSSIAIPIRAQISALVFQKAMRRKDVKGVSSKKQEEALQNAASVDAPSETASEDRPELDQEDTDPKGKQTTVNLIGVDSKRVADFCSFCNYFPGSVFKLVISFTFLLTIIGWKALLAGFLAMSLTIPINIFFSTRYASAQDRVMKVRDNKLIVVTEALQGIRQIKFSALEANWHKKIGEVREKELTEQWTVYVAQTFLVFCWIASPIALAATSLAVYAIIYGELLPSVAFTAIGVFSNLELTLAVIPELTTDLLDADVSIKRIEKYLRAPEIVKNTADAPNISFEEAEIAWPSDQEEGTNDVDQRYVLRNVNISFPENELSVVSGKTGTGKSLLLAAILGEVDVLSGKINVPRAPPPYERHDHLANKDNWIIPSAVAFVAQIPWIENATIKENVLFGLPFDESRYEKVIEVCALRKDLDMLADGELTEIGASGINLSGGQRWRVTFARALYSRAGILVLDDIFSAVDAHVGRYIFEQALTGELGVGRTRILVTHHVALCRSRTKYIVELGEGTVEKVGFVQELEATGALQEIISHDESLQEIREDETAVNSAESSDNEVGSALKKIDSKKAGPKRFVEEEAREQGRVKGKVYLEYMKASGGPPFWIFALFGFALLQVLATGRSWWLKLWTGESEHTASQNAFVYSLQAHTLTPHTVSLNATVPAASSDNLGYYLGIYVAISIASALIGTFRYWYIFTGSIRASRRLFDKLSFTILRTPLRWMDTVPLGRILNRFTADFNVVDAKLSVDVSMGANSLFRLIGVVVAGMFVSPYVIILSIVLLAICLQIARMYLSGAREVKRLESNTKSPVFEQFGSALTGVGTIRAFDKCDTYITRMFSRIDDHSTSYWHLWAFNRWMGIRMALVGAFFATFVSIMILLIDSIDASLAGFALSFALEYGQTVIWTIRHYTNVELDMNAAERIIEYTELPTESLEGADPPAAWPSEGRLEVSDLVVGYAPDLPPVLKGLTFRVERNERIGVVGRTGAGKSSLTLALFRFLEAREGSIYIDGIAISQIKLHALRSRLAIIPQDPVLFSGTVRSNLDAFDEHTDAELRDALVRVHLITAEEAETFNLTGGTSTPGSGCISPTSGIPAKMKKNKNLFTSLRSKITEGGLNLSQGQRQLLCLARAIVSRPKIMVLDEATSAVDMATDTLIQRSIREEFGDATLLVIAHRLSTIADFDKILVMEDGRVKEFGSPAELWDRGVGGAFRGMVGESGERRRLEELILGEEGRGKGKGKGRG